MLTVTAGAAGRTMICCLPVGGPGAGAGEAGPEGLGALPPLLPPPPAGVTTTLRLTPALVDVTLTWTLQPCAQQGSGGAGAEWGGVAVGWGVGVEEGGPVGCKLRM